MSIAFADAPPDLSPAEAPKGPPDGAPGGQTEEPSAGRVFRLEVDPNRVEQDLVRLVLTLVEFLRRLMEAQAVRRLEADTITEAEAERLGLTLLRSKEAVESLCARLGVSPDTLNLDLGPLGRLL